MAKYKLETQFQLFKTNHTGFHVNPIKVEWFLYNESNSDEETRAFTSEELKLFQDYTLQNTVNFPPDGKNYFNAIDDEAPNCDLISQGIADEGLQLPQNIILHRNPSLVNTGIMHCMDIMLVNQGGENNHRYDLPFDVVGRILR